MKLFEDNASWNWVDDNNGVVGYRMSFENNQQCCEWFGYSYETKEPTEKTNIIENNHSIDITPFRFDVDYFKQIHEGCVAFRLIQENGPAIYLVIYNHHKGYYTHGFRLYQDNFIIKEGYL